MKTKSLYNVFALLGLLSLVLIIPITNIVLNHFHMPYQDEWDDNILLYFQYLHGHFSWRQLFAFHNEHRLVIERLSYLFQYIIAPKTTWLLNLFSYLSLLGGFIILSYRFIKTKPLFINHHISNQILKANLWPCLVIAALVFLPSNIVFWNWNYLIANPLVVFFTIAAIFCFNSFRPTWANVIVCILLSGLGTLSFSLGLLIWPICFTMLLILRASWQKLFVYGAMSAIVIVTYPHGNAEKISFDLLKALHYFFVFLGNIFQFRGHEFLNLILGCSIFLAYIYLAIHVMRQVIFNQNKTFVKLLPWVAMGLFSLGAAAAGSLIRNNVYYQALSMRYSIFSALIYISVFTLTVLLVKSLPRVARYCFYVLLPVCIGFYLITLSYVYVQMNMRYVNVYPTTVALPYRYVIPGYKDYSIYFLGNYNHVFDFIKFYHSKIYTLGHARHSKLNQIFTSAQLSQLGVKLETPQFVAKIYPSMGKLTQAKIIKIKQSGFKMGYAVRGELNLKGKPINLSKLSNKLYFLNSHNKVVGMGQALPWRGSLHVYKPFLHSPINHFSFVGFVTKPEANISAIILPYKQHSS